MSTNDIKVSICGIGYVGLCLAAGLAKKGYRVICVDVDEERIAQVAAGKAPIFEPQLEEFLSEGVEAGLLTATLDIKEAVMGSDITFLCVGTPCDDTGYIDLKYIREVSKELGEVLKEKEDFHVLSVKSTVIPGTTDGVVKPIVEEYSGKTAGVDFGLAMTPEFLKEGSAIADMMEPDKTVIGALDDASREKLELLFSVFPGAVVTCDLRSAEMIKYANNSFLATKISFINEIANMCEKFGADSTIVARAIGLDVRIGPKFLMAGCGFGGSCFPKDVKALYSAAKEAGYDSKILKATLAVNEVQPLRVVDALQNLLGDLSGKKIAILGLAFKPDTDDMREAPVIKIVNELLEQGAQVVATDPVAIPNAQKILGDKISFASEISDALAGADAAAIVTEWAQFKALSPDDFLQAMNSPVVVDGRKIYDPKVMLGAGVKYFQIGYSQDCSFVPK
ncbi:MAG TPA: UDP-glucose/GDP-mannose dehydrogenase family protein [Candidatus Lokiarchaeia archaeon]|nr:UDP-glucose/GDP-mannose dehydrogenase family protein [Candidatus Lokiarchaeia archaeon]